MEFEWVQTENLRGAAWLEIPSFFLFRISGHGWGPRLDFGQARPNARKVFQVSHSGTTTSTPKVQVSMSWAKRPSPQSPHDVPK